MKKISAIIPTLQKNKELLDNLVKTLEKDPSVEEIIVIDNSTKGYNCESSKLKVITPKENIFVNPASNLGVKEAKNEIVALLNDDITIPINFCSNVAKKMNKDMGVLGTDINYVEINENIVSAPQDEEIFLKETIYRPDHFGIAMFFYKTSFYEIPEDLKILYGDDWLIFKNNKNKRKNYLISGQKIYHYSSLSVGSMSNITCKNERKIYKKHTLEWYQYIFDIEKRYEGFRIRLFGINSKLFPYKRRKNA